MVPFSFAGEEWLLLASGGLFWPRENALLVADLHLEKGSFFARIGQMIPPYDSRETLERIALAVGQSGARRVFCLGDSFHDNAGAQRLEPHAAGMLAALTRATDWVWITGNHDEGLRPGQGGTLVSEIKTGGVILRHHARRGETAPELSGHFHPRLRLSVRGRNIVRPCAVASENRLVLPAFGAFTGGMDAADPAILSALQPARRIRALLATKGKVAEFPLWAAA
ncbi:ligase-associated DNA damage response endonuclease PdeM [Novosphingobium sp.]|uniref:ligase-associated DNA damage response endonuclease PdeM n=1 Tax=Novosphingobium sp. TaxID=1874826 RepID=UPI00286DA29A|nr:ligase-associated DNA damage response endonuclease PdeM [Novosphingobium sp.]